MLVGLLILNSLLISLHFTQNPNAKYYDQKCFGVCEAGRWIKDNANGNDTILSNSWTYIPYFSDMRESIVPPDDVTELYEIFEQKKCDYVVVFYSGPVHSLQKYPYLRRSSFEQAFMLDDNKKVDAVYKGDNFTIYKVI